MLNYPNSPIQAHALSILYGASRPKERSIVSVGNPKHTESWISNVRESKVFGVRSWDSTLFQSLPDSITDFFLQKAPSLPWEDIALSIEAKNICVIRHGLPIGTLLKQAQDQIPPVLHQHLSQKSPYGALMKSMKNTALPTNPISLTRLSSILTPKGWYYVCDLAPYRDFGGVLFSDDPVVQADSHAAATGLVWRDSLFIRQPPRWSPQPHFSLGLHWRIANIAPSGDGYIYQTPEGLSIGLRHTRMLSSYTSWEELYIDLHAHIFSFVHSGLLQVYEV